MPTCEHDLAARETACADGMCPLCLAAKNAALAETIKALTRLLSDMEPRWKGFTQRMIWTADEAGKLASIRQRLDAAIASGKPPEQGT